MRQIAIDFKSSPIEAGYLGEHNATEIIVAKPTDLSGSQFSVAFQTNGEVIHSKYFSADEEIRVSLWQQLTQDNVLGVQLESYDENGAYIGKSATVRLLLKNSVHGTDVVADADNPDVYSEIAQNSSFRETLEDNLNTLDKLTTSETGKLLFDGKLIEGSGGGEVPAELIEQIEANTDARHIHANKETLDYFGINYANNRPTFKGNSNGLVNILATQDDVIDRVNRVKSNLEEQIAKIPKFSIEPVDVLPETDISETTVYLVRDNETDGNLYTEYIYVNGVWECLGSQNVDLTGYAKTEDIPTKTSELENDSGFITADDLPESGNVDLSNYYTKEEIDGKGFVTNEEFEDVKKELENIGGELAIKPSLTVGSFADTLRTRAHSEYLKVGNNQTVKINNSSPEVYKYAFYPFDENYNMIKAGAWVTEENTIQYIDPKAVYFGIVIARVDNARIDNELVNASQSFTIYYSADSYDDRINKNAENIETIQGEIAEMQAINYGVKAIYPADFESRLKPNVYCERFGEFTTDIEVESLKISGGVTVWISADGDDTNAGTETAPKKTLAGAFAVSGCKTVMIKEGNYKLGEHYTASQLIGNRNLVGVGTVIFDSSNNEGFIQAKSSAYIENIEFIGGSTCFKVSLADTDTFCAYKCKFHDDLSSNGLTVVGGNIYIIECEAYNTTRDGFNYHANTSNNSIPCVVEWNCYAHDCGDGTNTSSNGSTIHDGASIVRIGGEYCGCYGGVVADQGVNETTSSYSLNFGVYAHNSTIETASYEHFNASFWAQKYSKMWLYMCRSSNSTYDISSFENSVVNCMLMISADMWSKSNYVDESSTINNK